MYKTILHATDLQKNHYQMCQQALQIATYFQANFYLMHVIEPPPSLQLAQGLGFAEVAKPAKEDAQTVMQLLAESLGLSPQNWWVEIGSIKKQILAKATELRCDLIIVGSHSTHHLPSFLGSTAHAIVNHAPCDVLTLRQATAIDNR